MSGDFHNHKRLPVNSSSNNNNNNSMSGKSIVSSGLLKHQQMPSAKGLVIDKQNMQIETLASRTNYYEDGQLANEEADQYFDQNLNSYERLEQQIDQELSETDLLSKHERKQEFKSNQQHLLDKRQREWLIKHGKSKLLDFQDDQIRKLKECFGSLDGDGSGAIGIEELEDPLIGLGFADTREEVLEMIRLVDDDGSGMIEFPEFLGIIKNADGNVKTAQINQFFKDMTSGKLGKGSDMSFNLLVQSMRRQHLMNALLAEDDNKKETSSKILKNVARNLQAKSTLGKSSSSKTSLKQSKK